MRHAPDLKTIPARRTSECGRLSARARSNPILFALIALTAITVFAARRIGGPDGPEGALQNQIGLENLAQGGCRDYKDICNQKVEIRVQIVIARIAVGIKIA
jgi:hypothetical protein